MLEIKKEPQEIGERTFKFAVEVLWLTKKIPKDGVNIAIINQLIRSVTSIGANIEEAKGGHTKSDFAHSMNISKKEAFETRYWLRLLQELNKNIFSLSILLQENEELIKILTTIVKKVNLRKF